jgi:hypothetical protein
MSMERLIQRFGMWIMIQKEDTTTQSLKGLIEWKTQQVYVAEDHQAYKSQNRKFIFILPKDKSKVNAGDKIIKIGGNDISENPYTIKDIEGQSPIIQSYVYYKLVIDDTEPIGGGFSF